MSFLPEDYKEPETTSYYTKLEEGQTRLRILSDTSIYGWESWTDSNGDRNVHRAKEESQVPQPTREGDRKKLFISMVVWNYKENAVQILNITQASIRKSLVDLAKNEEWGHPKGYDITITRKGEKLDTEYSVTPSPKATFAHKDKLSNYQDIDLTALYRNEDPFVNYKPVSTEVQVPQDNERNEIVTADEIPF